MKHEQIQLAPYYNVKLTFELGVDRFQQLSLQYHDKAAYEEASKELKQLLEASHTQYQSVWTTILVIPVHNGLRLPLVEIYVTYHDSDGKTYLIEHERSATATIHDLVKQLADQDGKIKVLEGVVELKTQQMASLEKTNQELREAVGTGTSYLRVTNLERCNDNQQKIIEELTAKNKEQLASIATLEKTVDGLHAAISNAAVVHAENAKVADLNYKALQRRLDDEITKNREATKLVDRLSDRAGSDDTIIHNLRAQIGDLTSEKQAFEQEVRKLKDHNKNQYATIAELQAKADGLATIVRNDSGLISDRDAEVYALKGKVRDLENVVRNYTSTIAEYKRISEKDLREISRLQACNESLTNALKESKQLHVNDLGTIRDLEKLLDMGVDIVSSRCHWGNKVEAFSNAYREYKKCRKSH